MLRVYIKLPSYFSLGNEREKRERRKKEDKPQRRGVVKKGERKRADGKESNERK